MSRSILRLTLVPALLAAVGCGAPEPADTAATGPHSVPEYTIEQLMSVTRFAGASFSPDKSHVLVSSDRSGVLNAWAIPVEGAEEQARQLTHSTTDSIFVESTFPADERFLFSKDEGGNELDHLYVQAEDGTVRDLTPGEDLKAIFAGWARNGRSFFVLSNERDSRFFDLYEYDSTTYERELLYQDDTGLQFVDISPDKRFLALIKTLTSNDTDIVLYDRETGEMRNLSPQEGEVAEVPQVFSADGGSLYYTTDEGSEFAYLARYDLASGSRQEVLRPEWDVTYAHLSRRGEYLVVGINNDGRTEIRVFGPQDRSPVPLPELPGLDIRSVRFSWDAGSMSFYATSSRSPANLFVYDLDGSQPRRLTQSLSPEIDPDHLVEGEVVRFRSFDDLEIPGVLYKPHAASPESKVPAVVLVHGGPGGQSRLSWSANIQALVNHGYAVYAINNRGSSGYGKTFYALDDRRHGQDDLDDCVASKEMLAATGWIDPERIGILGTSYGGYMVLAALTFRPEEFAAGVDMAGISNWLRTLQSIPPWWEAIRDSLYKEMGHPVEDEEYLRSISPLFHAESIVRPLLVVQGANDPRVLKVEADEIVEAARANGVPVEYVVLEDEGHGIDKKENRIRVYGAVRRFLDTYLAGEAPAAEGGEAEAA